MVAWLAHRFLPDKQLAPLTWADDLPVWQHPYPLLLLGVFGFSILLALLQGIIPSLRPWVRHHAPLWASAVGLLMIWDLVTLKMDWLSLPYFMGPDTVLAGMFEDREILFKSTLYSLLLLLCGFGLGVTLGLILGVAIGWFVSARYWVMPYMKWFGPIPATALIPVVMTISTHAFVNGVLLIAYAVIFPMTLLTSSGIANVRLSYLDVARTLGAGRWYLIFRVAIPAAMPHIFIGTFIGMLVSFLALIVAESVGVPHGLGWYLKWQQGYLEYAKVYGSLIVVAFFCSGMITLLFKLRDWVLQWQKGVIKW
jgi:NitT/TauT family transport system permease protein